VEKIATSAEMGEFRYEGHRIESDSYGEGERS
jgi:hypothetical protein